MSDDGERGRRWLVEELGCDTGALAGLQAFIAMLRAENARQNLVAKADLDHLWWRHVVDSAQLSAVSRGTQIGNGPWLDLGTGAGFPGLVVALLDRARPVVLVEERRRRAEWLKHAAVELGLGQVTVHGCPLARVATFPAAAISARAFAPLPRLLDLAARFSTPQTLWLLPKGEKARQEQRELPEHQRAMFHVEPSVTSAAAGLIVGRGRVVPRSAGARGC